MFLSGDKLENGHYTVVKELGQGGMGVVFHCHDEVLQRDVAIKMLLPELMSNQSTVEVFHQEARLAAQLEHPNIVTIFDIGKEERRHKVHHYIAMEYLPGGNLAGRIVHKELSVEHILNWMKQLANGLQFAHKRGVVHQDIKADNIFITLEGDLKIGDFGLARLIAGRAKSRSSHGMGTPAYMSPELCKGEPQDHRSDIYSMGVLFYEMATGDLPYKARGMIEMAMKHASAPIPSARKVNPNIPDVLDKVIQKMMAKAPDERFQSMADVLSILDELIFELRVARLGLGPRLKGTGRATGTASAQSSGFFNPPVRSPITPAAADGFFQEPADERKAPAKKESAAGPPIAAEKAAATVNSQAKIQESKTGPILTPTVGQPKRFDLAWSFHSQGPIGWSSVPVVNPDESIIYMASADGRLYCLDAHRGQRLWTFDATGPILASPVLVQDKLIVACASGTLFCLSALDGKLIWKYQSPSALVSTVAIQHDTIFASTLKGKLLAIDQRYGTLKWQYQADDAMVSPPQYYGNLVFVSSRDCCLHAVDVRNGSAKWKFQTQGAIYCSPAVSADSVYAGSQDGSFYALEADTGRLIWIYSTDRPIICRGVIVFTSVIFHSKDHWLYCCDKYDGRLMWKSAVRGNVLAGLVTSGGSVFAVSREGVIQSFNARSGELRWQLETGKRLESPPVVTSRMLFVGSIDGDLMAFSLAGQEAGKAA